MKPCVPGTASAPGCSLTELLKRRSGNQHRFYVYVCARTKSAGSTGRKRHGNTSAIRRPPSFYGSRGLGGGRCGGDCSVVVVEVGGSVVVVVVGGSVVVVVVGGSVVVVVVGGNVVDGRGDDVVVVSCCVVGVVPGAEVVGVVGFDGVDVEVVVRGGNVARVKPEVVVVAKGPPSVVVVTSPPAGSGTVVPKKPCKTCTSSSPPSPPDGAIAPTSPEDAGALPWNQLMPIVTEKTRPPASATMTRPEMSRPTMTLLRSENERPCFAGPTVARCSAICLARSSGLNLSRPFGPRPLGGGTGVPFSP